MTGSVPNNDPLVFDVFTVNSFCDYPPPCKVHVKIETVPLEMEVDTGAPFSILAFSVYEKHQRVLPPLKNTEVKLRSFTKHSLRIAGVCDVLVNYKSKHLKLPVLIVHDCSVALMGRDWISKLGVLNDVQQMLSTNAIQPMSPNTELTLESVLSNHKELFANGLGKLKNVKVHLNRIEGVQPRFYKARPVPYAYKKKVEDEIDRLLQLGVLEPVSTSEWATPVVPVLKANGKVRICGDFKLTTNIATELEQYPLPNVEDLFARLSGGVKFSKIDLSDAYCQLELDQASKELAVINTHRGLFRYTRLAFGVASAPAIFQREMDKLLQNMDNVLCYLDDVLVTGNSDEHHLQNLNKVLTTLENAGIKLHPSKCSFMQSSVEYLGHRIDSEGLQPVKTKVDAITNAPEPTNVGELRSFIGLITYYAKFLPRMSSILSPLYDLLNKDRPWQWTKREKNAFCEAKKSLVESSLLVHFDENKELRLECDASPYGVGAVLSHPSAIGDRPIAFASRTLTKAEQNYSQIEREALALIFGVIRFRKYLLGRKFTLVTDHQPLVSLFSEKKPVPAMAASRIQRWALILSAYSYHIEYRKGASNANADACSRLPVKSKNADLPMPADIVLLLDAIDDSPVTKYHLKAELERNPTLLKVKDYIMQGWPKSVSDEIRPFWLCRNELSVEEGIIFRGNRVFVPPKYRAYVLSELHGSHQGMSSVKALARQSVWWPNIDKDIEALVRSCTLCQLEASSPPSYLAPWPFTKDPWSRIHIDHAGPFENHLVLVVVDSATKWLEVIPVSSTSSAATIKALRSVFARFGLPRTIVSDNGTSFTSEEFSCFLARNGIIHVRTAPYHPQSNGLAERAVRSMKEAMKKVKDGSFQERLDKFLFHFRLTPNCSSGVSPSMAMFNRNLRSRLDLLKPDKDSTSDCTPKFKKSDEVWCRNYGSGPKWIPGEVSSELGRVMSKVCTPSGSIVRHRDQLRPRTSVTLPQSCDDEDRSSICQETTVGRDFPSTLPDATATDVKMPDVEAMPETSTKLTGNTTLRRSNRIRKPPIRLNL